MSIRVHSWFVFIDDWVFHPRLIRTAGRGQCLPEKNRKKRDPPRPTGEAPSGSAGVSPACTPVACRSVFLRYGARSPCRREPPGLGRSRIVGPLPVEPGWRRGVRLCQCCAGGTPALPEGLPPMTSPQPSRSIGIRVYSCPFVVRLYGEPDRPRSKPIRSTPRSAFRFRR